jgi:AraC family transcriptional regulator of adaptative response / DNA-3-methyladenine glycosylase II
MRGVVGQQISVRAMTTLMGRIAARFGEPLDDAPAALTHTFPEAHVIAQASPETIAALGLPLARARTTVALAREVAQGLDLSPAADAQATIERLQRIPGIGPWTASYVALRALGWPDAFLPSDLGVLRALGETKPWRALARAEAWRPWRGYAVLQLWLGHAKG